MEIEFVQNEKELERFHRIIEGGLRLHAHVPKTVMVLPPGLSRGGRFTVLDSLTPKEVYVESFDTLDGALTYALGIAEADTESRNRYDHAGSLKERGNFV